MLGLAGLRQYCHVFGTATSRFHWSVIQKPYTTLSDLPILLAAAAAISANIQWIPNEFLSRYGWGACHYVPLWTWLPAPSNINANRAMRAPRRSVTLSSVLMSSNHFPLHHDLGGQAGLGWRLTLSAISTSVFGSKHWVGFLSPAEQSMLTVHMHLSVLNCCRWVNAVMCGCLSNDIDFCRC